MEATFFKTPALFRKWLEKNHDRVSELLVGFYKKPSGKPSITWSESVDQALCFGWIDGVRRRIDDQSYCIRFSRRRPSSNWSAINIKRATELSRLGLMHQAGLRAFEQRREYRSVYSYESAPRNFPPAEEKKFRANRNAWKYFNAQAPSYRRMTMYWVLSAKQEETRARRLSRLIDASARERRV